LGKIDKLIERLKTYPKDFTWEELTKVLNHFGYNEMNTGKTGGSRRKFVDKQKNIINLHKPHPKNILKEYVIKQIIEHLNL
jgi:predicted RNA binding protein YcfA (HicA-like mRNA interferase family)